jgi:hypothetical protein
MFVLVKLNTSEMLHQSDIQWNKFHETCPIYSNVIIWMFALSISEVI